MRSPSLPRPRLRGVHTSDVHLGAFDALAYSPHRDASLAAFRQVIDACLDTDADFLLIVGDFIDNAFVRDETLRFAMQEIARFKRPTVLLPGNHDHVGRGSVYNRVAPAWFPGNLAILVDAEGELHRLDRLGLTIWGRPHTGRDYGPLRDVPSARNASWQIALAHGHYVAAADRSSASYQITAGDLAACDSDYVALGHWDHLTRIRGKTAPAAYPGTPWHPGIGSASVLLVDLTEDGRAILSARDIPGGRETPEHLLPIDVFA